MEKRFSKNNMQCAGIITLIMMWIILCGHNVSAQASQQQYVAYLKVVKPVMDCSTLSYKYTLGLIEAASGKELEHVNGILLKSGTHFLDSNSHSVTLSNEGYIFKAQSDDKTAIVYSIKAMQKYFDGKDPEGASQLLSIPDSLLLKKGKFQDLPSTPDIIHFKYALNDAGGSLQEIQFRISKEKMLLVEIVFVMRNDNKLNRVFTLYDFNNEIDAKRLSTSNYFNVSGAKVILLNRFRSFKVNTLL